MRSENPGDKNGRNTSLPPASANALPSENLNRNVTSAHFRVGLVSCLAGGIGLAAGVIALVLYKLIGLFTNLAFYHRCAFSFASPRLAPWGAWIILIPVVGGLIVGFGQVRLTEDQRPWHSRGHGSRCLQPQPHPAAGRDFEAAVGRDRNRDRRPLRR